MKEGREPLRIIKESLTLQNQGENNAENGGKTTGGENIGDMVGIRLKSVGPFRVEYFNSNFGDIHFPNEFISHMY